MSEKIIQNNVVDQYLDDMVKYAIVVLRARALPELDDGLKPVQRRCIYALYEYGVTNSRSTKVKCAAIVGRVMERYHPHGDTSIYGTMTPMANWFQTKEPIFTPYGNYGTFLGDGAAAMRYTEIYFSDFGYDVMIGALKDTDTVVDWSDAATGNKFKEPDALPVLLPVLLINGSFGIAVGISVNIPPHNISEVIDATINLMQNPDAPVVLIPDHCFPIDIIDTNWEQICNTGSGKYYVRCKLEVSTYTDKNKIYPAIYVRGIPEYIKWSTISENLNTLIGEGKLPQIHDIKSKSTGDYMEEIIILKIGSDPEYVKQILYKHCGFQQSVIINFEICHGLNVTRMSYKSYLQYFIMNAKNIKFRLYCNKMQHVMTRFHQIDAYIKVLESGQIDKIIAMIRKSNNNEEIINWLCKNIKLTELQATFIISINLSKLSAGSLSKYIAERNDLDQKRLIYEQYIQNEDLIIQELINDLLKYKEKYGKPRICNVLDAAEASNVPSGIFKIIITENGYIRKIQQNEQILTIKNDIPKFVLDVDNRNAILLLDNKGKVFKLLIHKIPLMDKKNQGIDIRILIKKLTASVISVIYEPLIVKLSKMTSIKHHIVMVTENNYIKKLDLEDFLSVAPSGLLYMKLNQNDFVKSIQIVPHGLDIIIYSGHKALRINSTEVPLYKRNTIGSYAMNTQECISGLSILYPDCTHILVITKNGMVNKFDIIALQLSNRYKAGSSVIKLHKNDEILGIYGVNDYNIVRVYTQESFIDLNARDIVSGSTISSGLKLIPLKNNNIILNVDVIKTN